MLITVREAAAASSSPLCFTLSTQSLTNSKRFPRPRGSVCRASFSVPRKPSPRKSWNLGLISNRCDSSRAFMLFFCFLALQLLELVLQVCFLGFSIWVFLLDVGLVGGYFVFPHFLCYPRHMVQLFGCNIVISLCSLKFLFFSAHSRGAFREGDLWIFLRNWGAFSQ